MVARPRRHRSAALALGLALVAALLAAPVPPARAQAPGEIICDEFLIPMSDGVRLHGRGSRLAPDAPRPVMLSLTPYGKYSFGDCPRVGDASVSLPRATVDRFAVVRVSLRGTGASEGVFDHLGERTQQDIREAVAWIARQPWSNGSIVVEGASGSAFAEPFTVTDPHVKALLPITTCFDTYRGCFRPGGTYNGVADFYKELILDNYQKDLETRRRLGLDTNPAPAVQLAAITAVIGEMKVRDRYDDWWQERSGLDLIRGTDVPVYFTTDVLDFLPSANYDGYQSKRHQELNAGWGHAVYTGVSGMGRYHELVRGSLDDFVRRHGLGEPIDDDGRNVTLLTSKGSVASFLSGDMLVRYENTWPLPTTRWSRLYLRDGTSGSAESSNDDVLSPVPPAELAATDTVALAPAPGADRRTAYFLAGLAGSDGHPATDMRPLEAAGLTYTTEPLDQNVELTGPVTLRLFASATAVNFDWSVALTAVAPDGASEWLSEGYLRASLRRVDPARSQRNPQGEVIRPWYPFDTHERVPVGEVVEYLIEITPISTIFQAGHRLRLDVLPVAAGQADSPRTAGAGTVTVHQDAAHPSSVLLPLVPSRCQLGIPLLDDASVPERCASAWPAGDVGR